MPTLRVRPFLPAIVLALAAATSCARSTSSTSSGAAAVAEHVHPAEAPGAGAMTAAGAVQSTGLPAGAADVAQRLASSPRHAEWATIPGTREAGGGNDSVRAWVVYPERRDRAPVVVVIHEIFGLTSWVRGVADQLAADGFIAIAPDLLTGKLAGNPDSVGVDEGRRLVSQLNADDVHRQLAAVGQYGMRLPAARPRYAVIGFCWGGSTSFQHAVRSPAGLGAAVVYYGASPPSEQLASVRVPVLGLYGSDDARVDATVPPADSAMRALGKTFEHQMYEGAGHGFLRAQDGKDGANMAATRRAWPATIAFLRRYLGA